MKFARFASSRGEPGNLLIHMIFQPMPSFTIAAVRISRSHSSDIPIPSRSTPPLSVSDSYPIGPEGDHHSSAIGEPHGGIQPKTTRLQDQHTGVKRGSL